MTSNGRAVVGGESLKRFWDSGFWIAKENPGWNPKTLTIQCVFVYHFLVGPNDLCAHRISSAVIGNRMVSDRNISGEQNVFFKMRHLTYLIFCLVLTS